MGQRHDGSCDRRVGVGAAGPGPTGKLRLRSSTHVPGGGAHRRGRSTAPRAGGRHGRRPGDSDRPRAGAGPRRSRAAPAGGKRPSARRRCGPDRGGRGPAPGPHPEPGPRTPLRAALTSVLPQTQPDASAQAPGSTLRAPGPWKRRRPARDARNAARSSSRVNVCGGPGHERSQPEEGTASECSELTCGDCPGRGAERRPEPRPRAPAHLAQSPDAADARGAGARAETHSKGGVGREDDVVVAAGHALGVHGEEAARRVPGAPQARVVPPEAVGVEEERGGAWVSARP